MSVDIHKSDVNSHFSQISKMEWSLIEGIYRPFNRQKDAVSIIHEGMDCILCFIIDYLYIDV